ncbi:MAG: glycosyltransferase [Prevotella sp.]|nr:glycosyltransferase [Prevotella sp.]
MISIIVPVYNVEPYIEQCIESVLRQTYGCWELLLIDDGSTDGSANICRSYADKDKRIRFWQNSHAGPAKARNKGIEQAKGEFIYFMDSDDWIEPDTLECMLSNLQKNDADIACCGLFFDYPTRSKAVCYTKTDCVLSREEALKYIITGKLPSYLCILLLKRSVVIEPYTDVPCYEDYATGYKWFSHAQKVAMIASPKYHYIQREGSILHTKRRDEFLLDIYLERHQYIRQHQLMDEAENRANTVRNLLKLSKDYARKPIDLKERIAFVSKVRDALQQFLPVGFAPLGLKRWLRLKLLLSSAKTYVRIV